MSEKTSIYLVPGLGAGTEIFEYLRLPEDRFEVHPIEWLIPQSEDKAWKTMRVEWLSS